MLILVQTKNKLDQIHMFQHIYFEILQIHLQLIMYHVEHTNHEINLSFFKKKFPIPFLHAYNQQL